MPLSISEFNSIYKDKFTLIYADYVSLSASKPQQILIEESNILAHLNQYYNTAISSCDRQENLEKACNHLIRATLDLHKLVWVEIDEKITPFIKNIDAILCFNLSQSEVLSLRTQFLKDARIARAHELKHIGNNPLSSIGLYEKVNEVGLKLLDAIDDGKIATRNKMLYKFKTKEALISFVIGIVVTLLCSPCTWNWAAKTLSLLNKQPPP